ncbi:MAG TPA: hypothetical protein DCE41_34285 [Cytophagales bacterium]|nr:hypothetical protein [Cytophagales bacterium]
MNQHSGQGTKSVLLLGLIVGLLALSQVTQAQTFNTGNGSGTQRWNASMLVVNEDNGDGNSHTEDAGVRFQGANGSGDHRIWTLWNDASSRDFKFTYWGSNTLDNWTLGTVRLNLTESGKMYLYGANEAQMYFRAASGKGAMSSYYGNGTTGNSFDVGVTASYEAFLYNHRAGGLVRFGTRASGANATLERMRIDADGNILIGTTTRNSTSLLEIAGDAAIAPGGSTSARLNLLAGGLSGGMNVGTHSTGEGFIWQTENSSLQFGTNAAERMRIDASGNVLIGATSGAKGPLHVAGTSYMGKGILFENNEGSDFGVYSGSAYTTNPTNGTLMYDANWNEDSNSEPYYNVAEAYFADGAGEAEDMGGFAFWGQNISDWEFMLTTHNMQYLKGDLYSLNVQNGLSVGGNYTTTSGNITTTNGTITGNALVSNTSLTVGDNITIARDDAQTASTIYRVNGDTGNDEYFRISLNTGDDAFLENRHNGGIISFNTNSGSGPIQRLRIGANGQVGVGSSSFNNSNTAQLGVEGTFHATDSSTIGTTSTDANLTVFGTAFVKNLYIDKNEAWADYVFEEDYQLRSLTEVESFIAENGHLPDVMSAEEVATQGYAQTEVNETLLRKIEELTLYSIDLEKARAEQAETNATQQDKIAALEASNAELRVMLETILNSLEQE